jgi:hypothetical protein
MENNLKNKIDADFLEAYKSHNDEKVSVLRMLRSALKNAEIENKAALADSDVIGVIKKEIKLRKETIETYQKAGREEAANKEQKEIPILEAYLPQQLDENKIREIADNVISDIGATQMSQMGQVIGKIMQQYGDSVDGGTVSKVVREILQKQN